MTALRWDRLAIALRGAGLDVKVDARPYHGGVSRSISLRLPDGGLVEIHDKWWAKNPDFWLGWQVHAEGRDSIVTRQWRITKKHSEVVAAVCAATKIGD